MRPLLTLPLALALILSSLVLHAEKPATDAERATTLVALLGSDEFQEREDAERALDRLGAAALPALYAATAHPDPELRRRAAVVRRLIERRVETERRLTAPLLRLQYKNTPVAEVLADLSKRSGNPLKLATNSEELAKRPVTLDGEYTFWDALGRVCAAANLTESEPDPVPPPAPPEESFRGRGRRVLYLDSSHLGKPPQQLEAIALSDGKPGTRSVFQFGALRIRVQAARATGPVEGKFARALMLEIKPEPRINWEKIAALRIDRVLDDRGRELTPPSIALPTSQLAHVSEDVVIVWDGQTDLPTTPTPHVFALQFPVDESTSRSLREIRGLVAGWIRTPPETILTIDNLAKGVGETLHGPDGCRLKVAECQRADDGLFQMRIELTTPRSPNLLDALPNRIVRVNRRIVEKYRGSVTAESSPFAITNEKGAALGFVNGEYECDINGPSRVYTLVYKPDKDDKGPAKLVYRDRRSAFVEVPFTLKNVPLYKEK